MESNSHKTEALARAIRELAGLLVRTGRGQAAALLDDEAGSIATGLPARGLSALRRMNALRAGLAAASQTADELDRGAPERARLRELAENIGRALRAS